MEEGFNPLFSRRMVPRMFLMIKVFRQESGGWVFERIEVGMGKVDLGLEGRWYVGLGPRVFDLVRCHVARYERLCV